MQNHLYVNLIGDFQFKQIVKIRKEFIMKETHLYPINTGIQIVFECAMELLYHQEQKTDHEIGYKLLDAIHQMDLNIDLDRDGKSEIKKFGPIDN